jgi:hypothetical protein
MGSKQWEGEEGGNLCGVQLTDRRKEEEHLEHHQHSEYVSCVHVNTRLKHSVKKFWTPGPVKAKFTASMMKQKVLAFLDNKSMVCTIHVPRGVKVNIFYLV